MVQFLNFLNIFNASMKKHAFSVAELRQMSKKFKFKYKSLNFFRFTQLNSKMQQLNRLGIDK